MFRELDVSVAGAVLHFAACPKNGPPLVLLHGVCRRWQDYGPLLSILSSRWQVFAVDHRGHGRSSRAERYLVADYVADMIGFVAGLDQPAVLIGHSLGALTALGTAAAIPNAVRAIVLEDPPSAAFLGSIEETAYATQFRAMKNLAGDSRPTTDLARVLAEIELPGGIRLGDRRDAAALRFLARCLVDLDPNVLTPVLERRWLVDYDLLEAARSVRCPAMLLAADTAQGGMLPPTDADALQAALPDISRVNFPGVGHLIHGMRADLYVPAVMSFLDSL